MRFINPIELLGLADKDVSSIDSAAIKKAKRVVLAEIDLSDEQHFDYHNSTITKTDVERVTAELLDSSDNIEFYHFIANHRELNDFLLSNNQKLFNNFRQESIFKHKPFVEFISPFFTLEYEKILLKAYQGQQLPLFKKVISITAPITDGDLQKCYRSLTNLIKEQIEEVNTLTRKIKNEESTYDESDIEEVEDWVTDKIDVHFINALPNFFQNTRNAAAQSIRNLSVSIFNAFSEIELALSILNYALSFKIDGLVSQNLNKDLAQLNKINDERQEKDKVEPILQKYAALLIDIRKQREDVEKKLIYSSTVQHWVNLNISVPEINALEKVFDEIRNQIALSLRGLSVAVWNTYSDIEVAIYLINKASRIKVSNAETLANLNDAKEQLNKLNNQIQAEKSVSTYTPSRQSTSSSSDNSALWFWGIIGVLFLLFLFAKSCNNDSTPSYSSASSNSYDNSYSEADTAAVVEATDNSYSNSNNNSNSYYPPSNSPTYTEPEPVESPYKGNRLNNGTSPFDDCFGSGQYGGSYDLTVENYTYADAIICIYDIYSDQTIRNEYVKHNSTYTLSNIPDGYYKIRVVYGNDWNPNMKSPCGSSGFFESDVDFKETDDSKHFEAGYGAKYTLHAVVGGNTSSSEIDKSKFFRK